MKNERLGKEMKRLREEVKLKRSDATVRNCAMICGVKESHYQQCAQGKYRMPDEKLQKLAIFLDKDKNYFINYEKDVD